MLSGEKKQMKKISLCLISIVALGGMTLQAQDETSSHIPVTLGLKVGIPVTDMFSASNTTLFNDTTSGSYSSAVPRYEFGVSAEFHMPFHLRFEVDGLFKRGGFGNSYLGSGGSLAYSPTTFNDWEIPGLFKYNISMGHLHPFVDFGASLRHISTINQTTYSASEAFPVITDNSRDLHNRNSFGAVAGIGLTFKKGPFELTPEARYTRWANESFMSSGPGLRTNLDQGDVLLGIGF
jgi:Outer membrane protein beta-barrel domain